MTKKDQQPKRRDFILEIKELERQYKEILERRKEKREKED